MAISAVENVKTKTTEFLNKHNAKQKGAVIGAGVGAILSGNSTRKTIKAYSEMIQSKDVFKKTLSENLEKAKRMLPSSLRDGADEAWSDLVNDNGYIEGMFEMTKQSLKSLKKAAPKYIAIGAAVYGLIGLGIGAIIDHKKNKTETK